MLGATGAPLDRLYVNIEDLDNEANMYLQKRLNKRLVHGKGRHKRIRIFDEDTYSVQWTGIRVTISDGKRTREAPVGWVWNDRVQEWDRV